MNAHRRRQDDVMHGLIDIKHTDRKQSGCDNMSHGMNQDVP